ncbi:sulfurtransferase TusA family protein [Psychrobacter celer]|uniref:sulfurtransferase TusA family protein n=1 Tax=Psychrobacter celer TaxID=306572 RepID=UPI003FD4CC7A
MSADSQPITRPASDVIYFAADLPATEQQQSCELLRLLGDAVLISDTPLDMTPPRLTIKKLVDGRGLACPMPLLKTKVALREVAAGESLYVVATDPNSQADIAAFCRQSQQTDSAVPLSLSVHEVTHQPANDDKSVAHFDTIYHFIITKTDSN